MSSSSSSSSADDSLAIPSSDTFDRSRQPSTSVVFIHFHDPDTNKTNDFKSNDGNNNNNTQTHEHGRVPSVATGKEGVLNTTSSSSSSSLSSLASPSMRSAPSTNTIANSSASSDKSSDSNATETSITSSNVELQSLPSTTNTSAATTPRDKNVEGFKRSSSLMDNDADLQDSPDANCFERKKGWNRAVYWSICFSILGVLNWVVPLFLPGVISVLMQQQICDQLCVPIPNAGATWVQNLSNPNDWKINNFLTNANRSWWPEEHFNVYIYHINNSDAVQAGKESKLKVQVIGPYVFTTYRYKYNSSFSADFEQIFYNEGISYTFNANLSYPLTLNDAWTTINMPLVSTLYKEWNSPAQVPLIAIETAFCTPALQSSCLFQKNMKVQQILFSSTSSLYQITNLVYLSNNLAPTFQLFFNYSTNTTLADQQHLYSSYGMGGTYKDFPIKLLYPNATTFPTTMPARPAANTSLLSSQYTGQGSSYSNLFSFTQYQGNSSINVWNGPENITGTDHFQFSPPITPESIITVWDNDIMRTVNLEYDDKVSILGSYDAYRFKPTADLFDNNDPHYYGQEGFEGLLFVGPVSQIHYGVSAYAYASRPFLAGVNSTLASSVNCTNCPDMSDPADWLDIYVDIEPNTGKVLGGSKRGQINALIGQPYIFNGTGKYANKFYQNIPYSLVPVVYFEYTQEIQAGDQTNQLDDGLDKIKLARTGTAVIFYLLLPIAVMNFMAAFFIALKADQHGTCCSNRSTKSVNTN